MTGEIVNLRLVRKAKARMAKEEKAAEHRAVFGRSRAAREADAAIESKASRHLDAHRLMRPTARDD